MIRTGAVLRVLLAIASVGSALTPTGLGAQARPHVEPPVLFVPSLPSAGVVAGAGPGRVAGMQESVSLDATPRQAARRIGPANAALRSALIPGAGQLSLGQRRSWVYLGLEAAGWFLYLDRRGAGSDLRAEYRDFAWTEGRLQLGPRVDGDFDYYETMSNWDRSGAYDLDAGTVGVQPESNTSVYNGLIWSRAVGIYSVGPGASPGDPQYDAALAYYGQRAYGEAFLWDWTTADPGARTTYAGIIRASDDRFRQARNALGLVIANHLVSAVDAFVSARAGLRLESTLLPGPAGGGVSFAASVRGGAR